MDSMLTAAARALTVGDPLGALNRVALRDDAPALALRGIAMAQLGDLPRAKLLLRKAARRFEPSEQVARARCVVAEAEIALAMRELGQSDKALEAAYKVLANRDPINAAHARYVQIRRLLLMGQLDAAERLLAGLDAKLPFALTATHELLVASIAIRRVRATEAESALDGARAAATKARIPALAAEIENAARALNTPVARIVEDGVPRLLLLEDVERLYSSGAIVVDTCRHAVRDTRRTISLARRPVLLTLARLLAAAWPEDASRQALASGVFRAKRIDESYRARLRVEVGRLRKAFKPLADIEATEDGFVLNARGRRVVVLEQPIDEPYAAVLALLADGEAWSSSAIALALGISQRAVQRTLDELAASAKIQSFGRGRARRWLTPPLLGFATTLLLPTVLPND